MGILPLPLAAWAPSSPGHFGAPVPAAPLQPHGEATPRDDYEMPAALPNGEPHEVPGSADHPLVSANNPAKAAHEIECGNFHPSQDEVAALLEQFARADRLLDADGSIRTLIQHGPLNERGVRAAGNLFSQCMSLAQWGERIACNIAMDLVRLVELPDRAYKAELACGTPCYFGGRRHFEASILDVLKTPGLGEASSKILDKLLDDYPEDRRFETLAHWVREGQLGQQTDFHVTRLWGQVMDQQALNQERANSGSGRAYAARMEKALAIIQSGVLGDRTADALRSFLGEFERGAPFLDYYMLPDAGVSSLLQENEIKPGELTGRFPIAAEAIQRRPGVH